MAEVARTYDSTQRAALEAARSIKSAARYFDLAGGYWGIAITDMGRTHILTVREESVYDGEGLRWDVGTYAGTDEYEVFAHMTEDASASEDVRETPEGWGTSPQAVGYAFAAWVQSLRFASTPGTDYAQAAADDDFRRAVSGATAAFWQAVADAFPDITTGDIDPAASVAFDDAAHDAVAAWVDANTPQD